MLERLPQTPAETLSARGGAWEGGSPYEICNELGHAESPSVRARRDGLGGPLLWQAALARSLRRDVQQLLIHSPPLKHPAEQINAPDLDADGQN